MRFSCIGTVLAILIPSCIPFPDLGLANEDLFAISSKLDSLKKVTDAFPSSNATFSQILMRHVHVHNIAGVAIVWHMSVQCNVFYSLEPTTTPSHICLYLCGISSELLLLWKSQGHAKMANNVCHPLARTLYGRSEVLTQNAMIDPETGYGSISTTVAS